MGDQVLRALLRPGQVLPLLCLDRAPERRVEAPAVLAAVVADLTSDFSAHGSITAPPLARVVCARVSVNAD